MGGTLAIPLNEVSPAETLDKMHAPLNELVENTYNVTYEYVTFEVRSILIFSIIIIIITIIIISNIK